MQSNDKYRIISQTLSVPGYARAHIVHLYQSSLIHFSLRKNQRSIILATDKEFFTKRQKVAMDLHYVILVVKMGTIRPSCSLGSFFVSRFSLFILIFLFLTFLFLTQEGSIAERICRIIETSLKSPHVPLQV